MKERKKASPMGNMMETPAVLLIGISTIPIDCHEALNNIPFIPSGLNFLKESYVKARFVDRVILAYLVPISTCCVPYLIGCIISASSTTTERIFVIAFVVLVRKSMADVEGISASEEEVYDRQLRLWGRNAQSRLKSSSVLIYGLSAINVEVAKNVLLAGANITLADDRPVSEKARSWDFLLPEDLSSYSTLAEASAASLREMNPLANVNVIEEHMIKIKDYSTASIDIVVNFSEAKRVAETARAEGVAVFLSFGFGGVGWWCGDMVGHRVLERSVGNKAAVDITTTSFADLLSIPLPDLFSGIKLKKAPYEGALAVLLLRVMNRLGFWPSSDSALVAELKAETKEISDAAMLKFLEPAFAVPRLLDQVTAGPIPPCAAVVGGLLGQEVVKVVTRRDEPLINTVTYTCRTNGAQAEKMPPRGKNEVTEVENERVHSCKQVATVLDEDDGETEIAMEVDELD